MLSRLISNVKQQNIKCTTHTVLENTRRKDSKRSTAQSLRDSSTSLWSERVLKMVRSRWLLELSSKLLKSSTSSLTRTHWRSFSRLSCKAEPERTQQIGSGGTVRRQAVDVSPLRRVNQAIYLMCKGSRDSAFRSHKSMSECLADEIIAASKGVGQGNSYAVKKKDEIERVAKGNR